MSVRTALVTGASGFIGSALVQRLVEDGVRTLALVRTATTTPAVAARLAGAELLAMRDGTTDELHGLLADKRPEVVYHLASTGVRGGATDQEILRGNVDLMANLLYALAPHPPRRFLHTGSCFEYGAGSGETWLTEESPTQPLSVYGAAKLAAYHRGRMLARELSIPFVNLRLFGVYGPGEHPQRLIPYLIECLSRSEPVELSSGEQVRDFIHVDDVIEALLVATEAAKLAEHDVYNVCTGEPWRVRDVAEFVARTLLKPASLLHWGRREYRAADAPRIVGSNRRFVQATGWRPQVTLRQGIAGLISFRGSEHQLLRAA